MLYRKIIPLCSKGPGQWLFLNKCWSFAIVSTYQVKGLSFVPSVQKRGFVHTITKNRSIGCKHSLVFFPTSLERKLSKVMKLGYSVVGSDCFVDRYFKRCWSKNLFDYFVAVTISGFCVRNNERKRKRIIGNYKIMQGTSTIFENKTSHVRSSKYLAAGVDFKRLTGCVNTDV